jgi:hypothetical protein
MPTPTAVSRYLLLVLPAIFLFTSGARLYGFFHERSDIWWTPRRTLVPLAESHDRVAIYVRSGELDDLLATGQLRLLRDSVGSVVSPADIGLRFNNWDRVRAGRIFQPAHFGSGDWCGGGTVTRGHHPHERWVARRREPGSGPALTCSLAAAHSEPLS